MLTNQYAGNMQSLAGLTVGWCQKREKIDWQEPGEIDCQLVLTIFIFCCQFAQDIGEWPFLIGPILFVLAHPTLSWTGSAWFSW